MSRQPAGRGPRHGPPIQFFEALYTVRHPSPKEDARQDTLRPKGPSSLPSTSECLKCSSTIFGWGRRACTHAHSTQIHPVLRHIFRWPPSPPLPPPSMSWWHGRHITGDIGHTSANHPRTRTIALLTVPSPPPPPPHVMVAKGTEVTQDKCTSTIKHKHGSTKHENKFTPIATR